MVPSGSGVRVDGPSGQPVSPLSRWARVEGWVSCAWPRPQLGFESRQQPCAVVFPGSWPLQAFVCLLACRSRWGSWGWARWGWGWPCRLEPAGHRDRSPWASCLGHLACSSRPGHPPQVAFLCRGADGVSPPPNALPLESGGGRGQTHGCFHPNAHTGCSEEVTQWHWVEDAGPRVQVMPRAGWMPSTHMGVGGQSSPSCALCCPEPWPTAAACGHTWWAAAVRARLRKLVLREGGQPCTQWHASGQVGTPWPLPCPRITL